METRSRRRVKKEGEMSRYCSKCFTLLPEDANYCPTCGECLREVICEEVNTLISSEKIINGFEDKAIRFGQKGGRER